MIWWYFFVPFEYENDYDYERLSSQDCTQYEVYDPTDGSCYFECDTDEECAEIEEKIQTELNEYVDFFEEDISHHSFVEKKPNVQNMEVEEKFNASSDTFNSGKVELSNKKSQSSKDLLWNKILIVIPENYTQQVERFVLFNDPTEEEGIAYVERNSKNPEKWDLFLNKSALYPDGIFDEKEFVRTVLHEFMHIITLSDSSLDERFYSKGTCPTVDLDEGCLKKNTMLLNFIDQFWDREDHDVENVYQSNIFVTDYASSNAVEDVAESFMFFILEKKPAGASIREQKVRFFYGFEEMIDLRKKVREGLIKL